ncbi:jg16863 [Pararge aegeria aegeria]|uniref:Jg16863 protein n=1 Tax=Pararge aegeria aegeria TaxID=348720 RepID=A0A8S4SH32_9NEOP|nr:jg16863 [Pararge aegeria aegeria]
MPSVKLALDHVNEHDSVLRNYRLHMWWNDTECNAAVGVKSFFDMMHSGPHKLMLFGAACTHVTDPIAKASKHWHLTQLSYADTHPMFTKEAFPNFFRIVPSENAFNMPRIRLLEHFNWTRVGTIYQNEPRYALAHNRLLSDLDAANFIVDESQSFATEVKTALSKLKEKDIRIILGNFNETWALKIFCEAYKLEMYGRAYTWLLLGTYSSKWWTRRAPCSRRELSAALDTTILTDLLPLSTTGETTVSGITAKDYQVEYDRRRGVEYSRFHGYTYDGIWAMALAIQTVAHRVKLKYKEKTVQDFRYRDKEWEQLFLDALSNVTFEGVTGPVRFYDNERKASILLKQFQGEQIGEVKVGEYCAERDRLDLGSGDPFKWVGKNPPKDRTLHLIEHTQVNITLYAVVVFCSVLGICLATGFLAMNIHFRNQRYIKMSSPHLNNLIIVGCMLTYLSVIFLGLDSSLSSIAAFPYICTARAWLLMAGFSLAFGAMFSKTWRVHSIFTDVKLNKKVIKDYQLFMVVGVLLCIDLIIMTTWQISDPFYRATKQMEAYPHPTSEDIVIVQENEYCQSERMPIFIGAIYAYKGLLLVFGAFLAWETRHVSIPALNDSKHIGLSVYNVLIMCIMGAPCALVLADHKDVLFVLIAIFIIFCTTATLCLVFVPKTPEMQKKQTKASDTKPPYKTAPRGHRRMSSVSAGALLAELMHVPVDEHEPPAPAAAERKAIGQERDPPKPKQELEDILDIDHDYSSTERKKSCQRRDSEKRKKENFIVVQSDLWDTNTFQYTCQKSPPKNLIEVQTEELLTPPSTMRRGSEFPQPVSTPPHQMQAKRRQSSAQIRTYQEEMEENAEIAQRRLEDLPKKLVYEKSIQESKESIDRKPEPDIIRVSKKQESPKRVVQDPDTIRVTKGQESPSKRLRQEAEPLKRAKGVGDSPRLTQATQSRPDHHKSSPNVASRHKVVSPGQRDERKSATYSRKDSKRQESTERKMYTASSESELFECAILPIFHKLLTERHKSQPHGLNLSYGVSCPNISIKCDIVEYL